MAAPGSSQNEKPFGIVNIKAYVPLVLDLDQLNYDAWCELFTTHCISFGVLGHIDGTKVNKGEDDQEWTTLDSLVKLWIYGTITKPLLQSVVKKYATAREVWVNLENYFRDNKDARAIQLENELRTLDIGDLSIGAYFNKIKVMADLLTNIGQPVSDKTLVTYAINGLKGKFSQVVTFIRHSKPLPTFTEARSMLVLEELNQGQEKSAFENPSSSIVLVGHTPNPKPRGTSNTPMCRNFSRGVCRFDAKCRFLHGTASSPTLQASHHRRSPPTTNPNPPGLPNHTKTSPYYPPSTGPLLATPSWIPPLYGPSSWPTPPPPSWPNPPNTWTPQPPRPSWAPPQAHLMAQPATAPLSGPDNRCSIEFDPNGFSVVDLKTRQLLLRCDSQSDLYPVTTSLVALVATSPSTWHSRLGHSNDDVLRFLISNNYIACNKPKMNVPCHACQLGKHTRLPFYSSTSVVSSSFDLVHSDVWTSPVLSSSGYKYYVIFHDHYSHFLWAYPLRNKSDVFRKLKMFRAYVQNQFNKDIKSLQCDHGGEFDNQNLHTLFQTNGITIRFSCPHTSQQNSKSKRMLRSIKNIIRTLLFQAHLPPTFWVEALNMAVHLLNILPSTVIHNGIPYTKLFNRPPSYSYLRTFGAFATLISFQNISLNLVLPLLALIKNGTWELVPRPSGTNIVRSLWLFRHKFHADGSLSRYKARLVANGQSQQIGVDCDETFIPVVKPATIRTVISLALTRSWPIHQLDVKNAFLHGNLTETVYMYQPPGFVDRSHPNYVCLLRKSLYGLKQAPRAWFQRFAQYALKVGFQHSKCDTSLFIYHHTGETAYLLLYVDDIVLTASSTSLLKRIISSL
ncbi:hypothetical protein OSB04_019649 [Centaurea solstitialis]|uniref:Uncharacterized protein n=1 Tax=Centaurea solstitialis TaxID=347529 RepID=A0AA38T277_9ASTR|nr:hypothetical protein OSB04_019649 [Centaurea solstitialis]